MADAVLDVVVIGGGFAGITAARDLRDRGLSVVLLEARNRIGGRTFSRELEGTQEVIELGGARLALDYMPNVAREVHRYGARVGKCEATRHCKFVVDGGPSATPASRTDAMSLERAWYMISTAAARISPHIPLHVQPVEDLDISWADFFEPLVISPAAYETVLATVSILVGGNPHSFSALQTLAWIASLGGRPYKTFTSVVTDRLVDGTGHLLGQMVSKAGLDVRLRRPVSAIRQRGSEVQAFTETGEVFTGRVCVLAVPTNVIHDIEMHPSPSAPKRRILCSNHQGRAYRANMLVRGAPRGFLGLGWRSGFQAVISEKQLGPKLSIMSGFGAEALGAIDLADEEAVRSAVAPLLGDAHVVTVDAHDYNADPYSNGSWRMNPPGLAHKFALTMNEPENRIVFAGSDVSFSTLNGWIEGAIDSGHYAAGTAASRITHDARGA